MTLRRRILVAILVLLLAFAGVFAVRNPEKATLDDAARREAPGRFVTLGDGVTHYDLAGPDSGRRVVLVHGFSVPYYIWDSTFAALSAAGFRVARYDLFGRGWSDRPVVPYTPELLDRQLGQLLDSLGWREPVDVIGLSMGGPVSARFAASHPERVRTLTLIAPASGPTSPTPGYFKLPVLGPLLWQVLAVPGMAEGQRGDFVDPSKWPDWADKYRVQMRYRGFGRALLSTRIEGGAEPLDSVYARLGRRQMPVLLIWGTEDQAVPIANAPGVMAAVPRAEYHPIEGVGHLPHIERAGEVNPMIVEFLTRPRG